ncbi:hypothetical protein MGN70_009595 [Eutypa lata]|uniref:Uncharacterized protein n=1 Tax=Eutypa lata (strain UCR-EL1) TaxID=1287681 RepID=M7SX04_EUTLA|nr:hypothetical protein UCREL1_10978 [Eutypa lata UCREL1]KAI1248397.1 hypothetical protein MGN70_009595 [Eutypa lata]
MSAPEVSHGRGGAGNINPDSTKYVDGEIVRAGPEGSHEDGAYSTGRGGGGNIADAGKPPGPRADGDVVPEEAVVRSSEEDRHVGRGGAANIELGPKHQKAKVTDGTPTTTVTTGHNHIGLADKLKNKLLGIFNKK